MGRTEGDSRETRMGKSGSLAECRVWDAAWQRRGWVREVGMQARSRACGGEGDGFCVDEQSLVVAALVWKLAER